MSTQAPIKPGIVSPRLPVPASIPAPDYARSGRPKFQPKNVIANNDIINRMRETCRLSATILDKVCRQIVPGMTTDEVDKLAHRLTIEAKAYPSCLNYHHYPKSICTSINEVICHGIPDNRPLQEGDIVNIDLTIYKNGVHGDCSKMVCVGNVSAEAQRLVNVTYQCMMAGIHAALPGNRVMDIGKAIVPIATANRYSVVSAYCGHGINTTFHNSLYIPHNIDPTATEKIVPGMIFTIEPMINQGVSHHKIWRDNWTAVTADGKLSAQFEHTILIREDGIEILTIPEGQDPVFISK